MCARAALGPPPASPHSAPPSPRLPLQAILKLPPNKPLHADDRALLWRFRASLTSDTRALTKFLKCVDWGDALEAKQVREWRIGSDSFFLPTPLHDPCTTQREPCEDPP